MEASPTPAGTSRRRSRLGAVAVGVITATAAWAGVAVATGFNDVAQDHTHAGAIEWAAQNQITLGCGDGTSFCPAQPVTRAQMVTFLRRLAGHDPDIAPSVDAATLGGHSAEDLLAAGGVSAPQIVTATNRVEDGASNLVEAECPDGSVVIGGGGRSMAWNIAGGALVPTAGDWHLSDSRPGAEGDSWVVRYQKRQGTGVQDATAFAVCAEVGPAGP